MEERAYMYLGPETSELGESLLDATGLLLDGVHGDCASPVLGGACVAHNCSRKEVT